jgi:hypothetical protein
LRNVRSENGTARQATFRSEVDPVAYQVSAGIRREGRPAVRSAARYGLYALYQDAENYVEVFIDAFFGVFGTRAVVGGADAGLHLSPLPAGLNADEFHTIGVAKSAAQDYEFSLDGTVIEQRRIALNRGQIGVFTENTGAQFRNVTLAGKGDGWGDAFGDAARGLEPAEQGTSLDGYARGSWQLAGASGAMSLGRGPAWNALYQGNPNLENFAVQVDVQLAGAGAAGKSRYGLIVCHDDREKHVSMWIDPGMRYVSIETVLGGVIATDNLTVPPSFDAREFHTLRAEKSGRWFTFFLDGVEVLKRAIEITNGTSGVATWDTRAIFRSFSTGAMAAKRQSADLQ